jgi:hypothetical protein
MKAMTEMENAVMNMTGCPRETANLVVNAILDIDKKTSKSEVCEMCGKETTELHEHNGYDICQECLDNVLDEEFFQDHGRYAGELE